MPQSGSPQSSSSLNVIFRPSPREPFLGLKGSNCVEGASLLQEPSVTGIKETLKAILATILAFFLCCLLSRVSRLLSNLSLVVRGRDLLSLQLQLVRDGFTQSNRKNEKEKMRRRKLGCRDRADKVAMIGANALTILETDGKYDGGDARQLVIDGERDSEKGRSHVIG